MLEAVKLLFPPPPQKKGGGGGVEGGGGEDIVQMLNTKGLQYLILSDSF